MKNNGKLAMFSIILLIAISYMAGCSRITYENAENKGDAYFYDKSTGKIYTELSDNFDFKIEKWKYYYDKESDQDRILFSIAIKNKTGKKIDDFIGTISLNKDAANLIASGILTYDKYEPYNLIPNTTANGVSYAFDLLIERDEWLEEISADKDVLLDKIRYMTLELSWDGGKETVELVLDKLK